MTIYLDSENICHIENGRDRRAIETDFFDGKCREFIEGYRYIPVGETWVREDGQAFEGEMMIPIKPYEFLLEMQSRYDAARLADVTADRDGLVNDIGALIEEIYQEDLEVIG